MKRGETSRRHQLPWWSPWRPRTILCFALLLAGSYAFRPRFQTTHCTSPPESVVSSHLASIRDALERYREVEGHHPEHPAEWSEFARTHIRGRHLPRNPLNGNRHVRFLKALPDEPMGNQGWIYALSTGDFRCNALGTGYTGTPYFDL